MTKEKVLTKCSNDTIERKVLLNEYNSCSIIFFHQEILLKTDEWKIIISSNGLSVLCLNDIRGSKKPFVESQ